MVSFFDVVHVVKMSPGFWVLGPWSLVLGPWLGSLYFLLLGVEFKGLV
jgi:hypothetical protein